MRISQVMAMAAALLLAAGCAHEQQTAQYDESFSPANSSGRMNDYADRGNNAVSSSPNPANAADVTENAMPGMSRSESDNAIVAAVRESLRRNAEIAPIVPNIQITANNGAVVLNGSVQGDEQKRQIGAIAQETKGVLAVNNQLQPMFNPLPQEPAAQNQPNNPQLNPTSSGSNSLPRLYQSPGDKSETSSSNALNPTSLPSSANKIYQEAPQQQNQETNSHQMQ